MSDIAIRVEDLGKQYKIGLAPERYRTLRGYKRPQSAINVSRFLAFCGNYLSRGGVDLACLVA